MRLEPPIPRTHAPPRKEQRKLTNLAELTLAAFVEEAEEAGAVEEATLEAYAVEHELDDEELGALRTELETRGVDVVKPADDEPGRPVVTETVVQTTDSLTLFMN